jgi:hypothetical protein
LPATYALADFLLASELRFPELPEVRAAALPAVRLEIRPIGASAWSIGPTDAVLIWPEFGSIRIRNGEQILVDPVPGLDPRWLRAILLGPVYSLLMQQRGAYPLHASAVRSGDGVIAVAAPSGGGKSTLAAALHARGMPFFADDVTALRLGGDVPIALPAFPRMKLGDEALEQLGESPEAYQAVHVHEEKRARMADSFCDEPLPLRALYVLEDAEEDAIEPIARQEAFRQVMTHCHRLDMLIQATTEPALLAMCVDIASRVPLYRLKRRKDLAGLERLAERVEEHARG